ncbi:MAG: AAA family ATPase, partial [Candidatus Polarisedimenticolia bacterium]
MNPDDRAVPAAEDRVPPATDPLARGSGLLDGGPLPEERAADLRLRPRSLDEYIGQDGVKANLKVFIQAALERGEPLDHVLLYGPPGLGKTTLAHILSQEMRATLRATSGPAIEKAGDLAAILTSLEG